MDYPMPLSLSSSEFRRFATLAESDAGLFIDTQKASMVQARLARRLKSTGCSSYKEYLDLVEEKHSDERRTMISSLTTNVTHFFREPHHFQFLNKSIAPELRARLNSTTPLRVWSAGCSTGQEPYSIAMTLAELSDASRPLNFRILATDINDAVLERARNASFSLNQTLRVPEELRNKYLRRSASQTEAGNLQLSPDIQNTVRFERSNLANQPEHPEKFDLIFCRNVIIYFRQDTQRALWRRLRSSLATGGYLFIGHSERIDTPSSYGLKSLGNTIYSIDRVSTYGLNATEATHGAA